MAFKNLPITIFLLLLFVCFSNLACDSMQNSWDIIKAETAYNQGKFNAAIKHYSRLIQRNPANTEYYWKIGIVYYSIGDKQKVVNQIDRLRGFKRDDLADDLHQLLDRGK